jgi:EpsI family protein
MQPALSFLKRPPALILTILLAAQASVFYGFSRGSENIPLVRSLDRFPAQLGGWRMIQSGVIEDEVKEVLRADDYLTRFYANDQTKQVASLFVAYFRSQRAGQTPHSPKNCLPGSGWIWTISDTIPVTIAGLPQPIEVNRYVVSKGEERAMVLYWYQSRDRVVASEYKAAAYSVNDALRYNHTDTALVRVVIGFRTPQEQQIAYESGMSFIQSFYAPLRGFFPA